MTIWDKIYKNYLNGGEAWATLSRDINPFFMQFIKKTAFKHKYVLDIGCGTGKHLKFLKAFGFKTDGIDSSESAVEMTKKLLNDNSKIKCKNMFKYNIPKYQYDLIISINCLHHGTKDKVQNLIGKIYSSLKEEGKIFITVPSFEGSKNWNIIKNSKEIAPGTFIPLEGPEKGLPHSIYTKDEVTKLFSSFKNLRLKKGEFESWVIQASK